MPLMLTEELVLCCEGEADRQFLRKMTEKRRLPKFDMPFPTEKLHGNGAFGGMLEAIRGNKRHFPRIKGVLIVADSTEHPDILFQNLCEQIRELGGYGIPSRLADVGRADGHPAVGVMTLPDEKTPGALETLLAEEMTTKRPWIGTCVDAFLRCDKVDAHGWPAEKRDKARFHSMVAVLNRDDPSKAASWAFKDPTPLIAVEASCFNGVERRIREFCAAVGAI
ncbi:MAG: DUF3226 domain-containing protein [Methylocella sp.]